MSKLTPAQIDDELKKILLKTFEKHSTIKAGLVQKKEKFGMTASKWEIEVIANDFSHFPIIIASTGIKSDYLLFYAKFYWNNIILSTNSKVIKLIASEASKLHLLFYPLSIKCGKNEADGYVIVKPILKLRLFENPLLYSFDGFEAIKYGFLTMKNIESSLIVITDEKNKMKSKYENRSYI